MVAEGGRGVSLAEQLLAQGEGPAVALLRLGVLALRLLVVGQVVVAGGGGGVVLA